MESMNSTGPERPDMKCDHCVVRSRSICHVADDSLQRELHHLSRIRTFAAGETIQREGEVVSMVGNVVSGVLRILKTMADGRQQIVGLNTPGDMFGRVFADNSYFAIEAATPVTLCCFDRKAFEGLLDRHGELEHGLLVAVLDELDAARDWMIPLGCQNVAERVASFLLILEHRAVVTNANSGGVADFITVPIKRRDLAAFLGTTVETISRTIQSMAKNGVIDIIDAQNFKLVSKSKLIAIAGREEFPESSLLEEIQLAGPILAPQPRPRPAPILVAFEQRRERDQTPDAVRRYPKP